MTSSLTPDAVEWLVSGSQGMSSRAIFDYLHFGESRTTYGRTDSIPYDPDDFQRCERLLRAVPWLRAEFPRMAGASKGWAALVPRWAEIAATFDAEAPGVCDRGWRGETAPATYALLSEIITPALWPESTIVMGRPR